MAQARKPVGIFSGTFDPIHVGHLRTAHEVLTGLDLAEVRFIPSASRHTGHTTVAPEALRLRMLEAALAGHAGFVADDRELRRTGPSYMVDTLLSLRLSLPDQPLCLILGMDAFEGLPAWHRWQEIPDLAHLVVARRPGFELQTSGEIRDLLAAREVVDPAGLARQAAGRILVRDVTQLEISSSAIRSLVAAGGDPRFLVPDAVLELIEKTHIYANPKEVRIRAQ